MGRIHPALFFFPPGQSPAHAGSHADPGHRNGKTLTPSRRKVCPSKRRHLPCIRITSVGIYLRAGNPCSSALSISGNAPKMRKYLRKRTRVGSSLSAIPDFLVVLAFLSYITSCKQSDRLSTSSAYCARKGGHGFSHRKIYENANEYSKNRTRKIYNQNGNRA